MTLELAFVELLAKRPDGGDVLLVEELVDHVFLFVKLALEHPKLCLQSNVFVFESVG